MLVTINIITTITLIWFTTTTNNLLTILICIQFTLMLLMLTKFKLMLT